MLGGGTETATCGFGGAASGWGVQAFAARLRHVNRASSSWRVRLTVRGMVRLGIGGSERVRGECGTKMASEVWLYGW